MPAGWDPWRSIRTVPCPRDTGTGRVAVEERKGGAVMAVSCSDGCGWRVTLERREGAQPPWVVLPETTAPRKRTYAEYRAELSPKKHVDLEALKAASKKKSPARARAAELAEL